MGYRTGQRRSQLSADPLDGGEQVLSELAQQDVLHTIAEVSAAFVGFSLVVGIFSDRETSTYRFYSIRDVAFVGLICLAGALVPSVVHGFDLAAASMWRVTSAVFSVVWLVGGFFGIRSYRRAVPDGEAPRYLSFGPFSVVLGNLLLWWNVLFPPKAPAALYVTALMLLLVFAGLSFVAAVFHGRSPPAAERRPIGRQEPGSREIP